MKNDIIIKTILLVEDEAITSIVTAKTLKKFGYNVVTADSGEKAIDISLSNKQINLILMDIDLGKGIDGTEAALIILKVRDIPIVFLSSHTEPEIVEKTEKITSYGYVVKNSNNTVLDASIKMAFKLFKAKLTAKEKEESYRFLVENLNDIIFTLDMNNIITYVSPQIERLSQFKVDEVIGKKISAFIHPDDLPMLLERYKLLLNGITEPWEFKVINKDSSIKYVRSSSNLIKKDGIAIGLSILVTDITKQKQIKNKLIESEEKYRAAFKTSPDAININTMDGRYIDINDGFTNLTGFTKDDVIGKLSSEIKIWEIKEDREKLIKVLLNDGSVKNLESKFKCKDESIKTCLMSAGIIKINGESHILSITRDITEYSWIEEELKLKNKAFEASNQELNAAIKKLETVNNRLIKNEKALHESEEQYRLLVENINLGIFISNFDGKFLMVNPALVSFADCETAGELLSTPAINIYADPSDRDLFLKNIQNSGSVKNLELQVKKKDGSIKWISLNAVLLKNDNITPQGIIGFVDDITERKQANEALIESRKKYQQIVETAIEGILTADNNSKITFISRQMSAMLGYSIEEMIGQKVEKFLPDDQLNIHYGQMKIREKGIDSVYEQCFRKKDGGRQWTLISAKSVINSNGSMEGYFTMITDITELKKAEEELKEKTEFFKNITDNMHDLVSLTDLEGVYTFVGKSHNILGYDSDFLIGKNAMDFVHPDDLQYMKDEFTKQLASNENKIAEYRYRCKDGSYLWFETIGKILTDKNHNPEKMIFSTRNITDRKLANENIQKLLKEKELIIKEVHHRIKNNMNTIYGLLFLQADIMKDKAAASALEDAGSRVQSMMILYDKLYRSQDYQKLSILEYLPVLVDEIIGNFHNSQSVKIVKKIEDFELSSKRLQPLGIIINELLTNIMKYAFIGRTDGVITVMAGFSGNGIVSIVIQDNGNGIPESVDFENSIGFGLKLVWLLTKELMGTIRLEREQGTKITIEFEF